MLSLAGRPLGLGFAFLDPAPDACAFPLGEALAGGYDDPRLLTRLADRVGVVTYEFENVPAATSRLLAERVPVFPPPEALAVKQDRLAEKRLFQELRIPIAPFQAVDVRDDLERAVAGLGLPLVLKRRSRGYDGKGQLMLRSRGEIASAWERSDGAPLVAEAHVAFDREVSVIAVRGRDGDERFYPVTENVHRDGILTLSRSRPHDAVEPQARDLARRILGHFDYVGVLALELFQRGDELLANELAPRVHNSGHWTIEGAETSQFENHLRAILGLALGDVSALGLAAMVN
jgi:5-(carboxyamino)imidazole ribonucleotide synthase